MANEDITIECIKSRVKKKELAEALGITDTSLSRKLRFELEDVEKQKIIDTISKLKK